MRRCRSASMFGRIIIAEELAALIGHGEVCEGGGSVLNGRASSTRRQYGGLDHAGFPIGSKVRVLVSQKRLVVELVEPIPERRPRLPRIIGPTDCVY